MNKSCYYCSAEVANGRKQQVIDASIRIEDFDMRDKHHLDYRFYRKATIYSCWECPAASCYCCSHVFGETIHYIDGKKQAGSNEVFVNANKTFTCKDCRKHHRDLQTGISIVNGLFEKMRAQSVVNKMWANWATPKADGTCAYAEWAYKKMCEELA